MAVGSMQGAFAHYRIGVALSPSTAHLHANLGVSYAMKGMTAKAMDEAAREFRIATELNPFFRDAHRHLGIAYGEMGYVRLQPLDPDYCHNLAKAYEATGRREKAEEQLRMAQSLRKK